MKKNAYKFLWIFWPVEFFPTANFASGKHLDFRRLREEVSIERFRTNDYVNKSRELPPDGKGNSFIRKGQVGDWKNHFTVAMNEEWDAWIESSLRGTGFEMTFE